MSENRPDEEADMAMRADLGQQAKASGEETEALEKSSPWLNLLSKYCFIYELIYPVYFYFTMLRFGKPILIVILKIVRTARKSNLSKSQLVFFVGLFYIIIL